MRSQGSMIARVARVVRLTVAVAWLPAAAALPTIAAQGAFTVRELAGYRLTVSAFRTFEDASRRLARAMREDPRFAGAPLFTRDIVQSGDAPAMAAELDARLRNDPVLAAALRGARVTSREYTTFALALFAAHLAHGFVEAGVLNGVPPGVAADNVAFIDAHREDVAAVLDALGVSGEP
jgi:hypothetical protein